MKRNDLKNSQLAVIAGIAILAACATATQAGDIASGFYVNTDPGLNMMTGLRGSGGSDVRLNAGARWDLEAGYGLKLSDKVTLGAELESGGIWNPMSSIKSGKHETELGGNLWQIPILANLILNYHVGKFTPYIGFGGGIDYISANVWSADNHPTIAAGSDWGPALQAQAGVRYQVCEGCEVGLGYKYLTAFSEKLGGNIGDRVSEVNNHTISLLLTYHF